MRGLGADPGQPSASATAATTGTARSAETVRTPSTAAPPDLGHGRDVGEVDRLADVGSLQARGLRVAVDRDDAMAELLRPEDRTALVAPGADEEDGLHVARDAIPSSRAGREDRCDPVPAPAHAGVLAAEARAHPRPRKSPSSTARSSSPPGISAHLAARPARTGRQRREPRMRPRIGMVAAEGSQRSVQVIESPASPSTASASGRSRRRHPPCRRCRLRRRNRPGGA